MEMMAMHVDVEEDESVHLRERTRTSRTCEHDGETSPSLVIFPPFDSMTTLANGAARDTLGLQYSSYHSSNLVQIRQNALGIHVTPHRLQRKENEISHVTRRLRKGDREIPMMTSFPVSSSASSIASSSAAVGSSQSLNSQQAYRHAGPSSTSRSHRLTGSSSPMRTRRTNDENHHISQAGGGSSQHASANNMVHSPRRLLHRREQMWDPRAANSGSSPQPAFTRGSHVKSRSHGSATWMTTTTTTSMSECHDRAPVSRPHRNTGSSDGYFPTVHKCAVNEASSSPRQLARPNSLFTRDTASRPKAHRFQSYPPQLASSHHHRTQPPKSMRFAATGVTTSTSSTGRSSPSQSGSHLKPSSMSGYGHLRSQSVPHSSRPVLAPLNTQMSAGRPESSSSSLRSMTITHFPDVDQYPVSERADGTADVQRTTCADGDRDRGLEIVRGLMGKSSDESLRSQTTWAQTKRKAQSIDLSSSDRRRPHYGTLSISAMPTVQSGPASRPRPPPLRDLPPPSWSSPGPSPPLTCLSTPFSTDLFIFPTQSPLVANPTPPMSPPDASHGTLTAFPLPLMGTPTILRRRRSSIATFASRAETIRPCKLDQDDPMAGSDTDLTPRASKDRLIEFGFGYFQDPAEVNLEMTHGTDSQPISSSSRRDKRQRRGSSGAESMGQKEISKHRHGYTADHPYSPSKSARRAHLHPQPQHLQQQASHGYTHRRAYSVDTDMEQEKTRGQQTGAKSAAWWEEISGWLGRRN